MPHRHKRPNKRTSTLRSATPKDSPRDAPRDSLRLFQQEFARLGYITTDRQLLADLQSLPTQAKATHGPVAAELLLGPPGTGKTFAAETFAKHWGAEVFLSYQFTPGVTKEDLMFDLEIANIATAQAGKWSGEFTRADTVLPGRLTQALLDSKTKRVVLLLDELDKANERIDAFLLEYLNDARLDAGALGKVQGNPRNLIVFITMNNQRLISEPLMRRCSGRVYLSWPKPDVELRIVQQIVKKQLANLNTSTRLNLKTLSTHVITLANEVRRYERQLKKVPSSPELATAVFKCVTQGKEEWGHTVYSALLPYKTDKEQAQSVWGKTPADIQKVLAPKPAPKPQPIPPMHLIPPVTSLVNPREGVYGQHYGTVYRYEGGQWTLAR